MNLTRAFLGDPAAWPQARLELQDLHGLWGGRHVYLFGAGRLVARLCPAPQYEKRYEAQLDPAEVARLFEQVAAADLLSLAFPPRPILPDEACPYLHLANALGETRSVHKWARDPHAGFDLVYQVICALAARAAATSDAVYAGPFDPAFRPA